MKKHLILSVVLLLSSCLFFCHSQKKGEWKLFKDDVKKYSIKYPNKWKAKGGKGGFLTGEKTSFIDASWMVVFADHDNLERIHFFFNENELEKGDKLLKKEILINSIKGWSFVITNPKRPDEYNEYVLLKTKSRWFLFLNDGIKDDRFAFFYNSFKLLD
ncbi:hypothetical protein RQM59_03160 [Flavobacteriaceae bacterium S356]|uniref:Lipoprotein n=1 Tax=Asprobacillus argus TaxID=3076534 RepID=A0ABU3LDI2_9FLAO|nr:hypothetical protein [Flavobacteriaceae bacterium S356]